MRIWFDTEFIDATPAVHILSIGLIREDFATYYAEVAETDRGLASDWVRANVISKMHGPVKSAAQITQELAAFCGSEPEFWAHYGAHDWVALCNLFGGMMQLPPGWPSYVRDTRVLMDDKGQWWDDTHDDNHHALSDAKWVRGAWAKLRAL